MTMNIIHSLTVSGTNLFAGTPGGGVFLSTDNGTSWTDVRIGLTSTDVWALAVSGTNLFAGTSHGWFSTGPAGVFLSTDNGTSWTEVDSALTNVDVLALAVSGTNLFAGTLYDGVWKRPLSEMITSVPAGAGSAGLPANFSLEQNYPNPFNPSTVIPFSVPSKAFVLLKIFDPVGREVSVLLSEELQAGAYAQKWDAADLASGIYFYRLQAGSFTETKKLILLR
jgi:hypothetical protein